MDAVMVDDVETMPDDVEVSLSGDEIATLAVLLTVVVCCVTLAFLIIADGFDGLMGLLTR